MYKEQIEKAANNYIESLLEHEIDYTLIDDEETTYETGKCDALSRFGKDISTAGADWRINSVWHDMKSEEPQVYGEYENRIYPQIPCLVYGKLSTGIGYGVLYWNVTEKCWDDEECDDYECSKDAIEQWVYLDDLMPDGKENAE